MDGFRDFGVIDEAVIEASHKRSSTSDTIKKSYDNLISLRNGIVGNYSQFESPFGTKPVCYVDWIASGRAIQQVEHYIFHNVLPLYGNTHTTTSVTGHQSTCFRHEARQIVAEAVNAKVTGRAAEDTIIFTGNGTTGAINKLISALGLNVARPTEYSEPYRPVVLTTSFEHHSNLLPWRECDVDVVSIRYSHSTGAVCLVDLARKLDEYRARRVKIGAFSAASNVTGILTDVDAVSALLHRAGGIVVFDYATAAPYVKIDMNPVILGEDAPFVYKDAIVFSGHKFVGGPGSAGVLVLKTRLLPERTEAPAEPGGGTVFYVTENHHRYLSNREEREEGGTPNLVSDVKLGLVMHLKQSFGAVWVENEERRINAYVEARLQNHARLVLLGRSKASSSIRPSSSSHLPVFSFLIRHGCRFLHFNFVCALLNDLFGVQSRGGCSCAGPFSQFLLGLTSDANKQIEEALLEKHEVLRPGYSRLSLTYWMSQEEIDYVVDAVLFIADHGWKFLMYYRYNHKTGDWAHSTRLTRFPERTWISNFNISNSSELSGNAMTSMARNEANGFLSKESTSTLQENLKVWGVQTLPLLFSRMRDGAVAELGKISTIFNKKMKKGQTHKQSMTGDGRELTAVDSIRWFVLADEISYDTEDPPLIELQGPIRPISIDDIDVEALSRSADSVLSPPASDYAAKRDSKLRARIGGEEKRAPRYLTLFSVVDDISIATAGSKVDQSTTSVVPLSLSNSRTSDSTISGGISTSSMVSIVSRTSTDKESDCTTLATCSADGLCGVRSGVDHSSEALTEEKILSGEGTLYAPDPHPMPFAAAPKKIMKLVGQAVKEWGMIQEGDRLLLGLSGGKDSLALLHILLALQRRAPIRFEIACATVDPQTDSFDPSPLIPYVQSLGVPYHFLSEPIVALARKKLQGDSLCAFCSRFKRGLLYSCCRRFKYNKLVLAQHLDDLAESFFMSTIHNGQIRTMKAHYDNEAGDVAVIRPLVYVRETATRDFSVQAKLPIINENCPACFEQPKERHRVKKLLMQEESMVPALFFNLRHALIPLMHDDTYAAMATVTALVDKNGRDTRGGDRSGSGNTHSKVTSSRSGRKGQNTTKVPGSMLHDLSDVAVPEEGGGDVVAGLKESEEDARPAKRLRLDRTEGSNGSAGSKLESCSASPNCIPCYEIA